MHKIFWKWNLRLFEGEGASSGGEGSSGEGTCGTTGETAAVAGQTKSLESLGVPKEKAERYRAAKARQQQVPVQSAETDVVDDSTEQNPETAAPEAVNETAPDNAPDAETRWKEFLADPEMNSRMRDTVGKRVSTYKGILSDLTPVLETIGQKYGMDVSDLSKLDYKALAKHVQEDDSFFEDAAADLGSTSSTARKVFEAELAEKRKANDERDAQVRQHYDNVNRQADALKQKIPGFDMRVEMQNPQFARMISPAGGLSVEMAYNAIHHDQIVQQRVNEAQRNASAAAVQKISNSVQAGRSMPSENGSVQRSSINTSTKSYSQMTPAERSVWLNQKKAEAARKKNFGR